MNDPVALLFVGALYADAHWYPQAVEKLETLFGPVVLESLPVPWHTGHYRDELGWPITRRFLFFSNPVRQCDLAVIKRQTIGIEKELQMNGNRRVNLDPGYMTHAKVVLASTKDYAHRIYLGDGIYAETTLYFHGGEFRGHLFTYRDYLREDCIRLFGNARGLIRHPGRQ